MKHATCFREFRLALLLAPCMVLALILAAAVSPTQAAVPAGPPTFSNPLDITNLYFPFQPGGLKVYNGLSDAVKNVVVDKYLTETRTFNWNGGDVECRVLEEVDFEGGELVEISKNFFAQADDGTVYYFGEVVVIYEDGVIVDHEGSWLVVGPTLPSDPPETAAASDPAVFMPADPEVGDVFKPEDLFPIVDETAEVIRVQQKVIVPAGRFGDAIKVKETSLLSPDVEVKWYAPGVGVVKTRARGEILLLIASTLVSSE